MSGISNRLDDWPVQNTKRIRKKPQRFVTEEEGGKDFKKKKQSKKPAAKLHNTNKIITVKASNIHKKMKIDQILKQGGMSIDPSTKGSSSLSTKYKTMAKRLNTNTNIYQNFVMIMLKIQQLEMCSILVISLELYYQFQRCILVQQHQKSIIML